MFQKATPWPLVQFSLHISECRGNLSMSVMGNLQPFALERFETSGDGFFFESPPF